MSSFCVESRDFNHFFVAAWNRINRGLLHLSAFNFEKKIAFTSDLFWGKFV